MDAESRRRDGAGVGQVRELVCLHLTIVLRSELFRPLPRRLAGLLDSTQRDALLAAIWLLASDPASGAPPRLIDVALGPLASPDPDRTSELQETIIPIALSVAGVKRNRVDPGVWEALDRVGRYSDSTANGRFRIELDCSVENPVDVARPS